MCFCLQPAVVAALETRSHSLRTRSSQTEEQDAVLTAPPGAPLRELAVRRVPLFQKQLQAASLVSERSVLVLDAVLDGVHLWV